MFRFMAAIFILNISCIGEQASILEQGWLLEEVAPAPPVFLPANIVEIYPASDDRGASYMEKLKEFCPGLKSIQELKRSSTAYINLSFKIAQCAEECNVDCEPGQNDLDKYDLDVVETSIKINNITNKILTLKPSSKNEKRYQYYYFYFDKETGMHYEINREPSSMIIKIQLGSCPQELPHADINIGDSLESINISVQNPKKNKIFNFKPVKITKEQIRGSLETGWSFVLPESCQGIFSIYPE
jgi:hypothetical protein